MPRLTPAHLLHPLLSSTSTWSIGLALMALAQVAHADTPRGERTAVEGRLPDGKEKAARATTENESPYANALRIARMLHDDHTVARLLVLHGLDPRAREGDLLAVVEAYETSGTPDVAVSFLRERIKRYPEEKRPRVILAELLARSGDTKAAVAVWREQIAKFGPTALSPDETHKYARDLSRIGDVDAAYDVLVALRPKAPDDAKEYWLDLAGLAWDRDDDEAALAAYEKVYKLDPKTPHAAARLIALYADKGALDEATRVALGEYARADDATAVLVVAHMREARGEWKKLKELMDAADARKNGSLLQREDWLLLEGDCLKQLGEGRAALEAYRRTLVVAPQSVDAKANILWASMERTDTARLREALSTFAPAAKDEPLLWGPFALGLARLGRYAESVPYFEKRLAKDPTDNHLLLELSDVLSKLDRHESANELRRRAVGRLRLDAVKALRARAKTDEDLLVIETTAALVRERSGAAQGERWLQAIVRADPRFRRQEEVAVDAYLATDRPDFARRILLTMGKRGREGAMRRYRLALAITEDDRAEMASLLEPYVKGELGTAERAHALVALGRDKEAVSAISEELSREVAQPESDGLRHDLTRIGPVHRPTVRVGGWYTHITGLDVAGPIVSATHDLGRGTLVYSASGVQMTERGSLLVLDGPRYEGDAGVVYRVQGARGVTEFGAAANYRPTTLVARAVFLDQRLVTNRLGISTEARLGSRIDETSFLRLAAVRNLISVGARYDETRWYASLDLEGREDQTRSYDHLAWDAVGSAEAGVKLIKGEPELAIGAQAVASQRENRTRLPEDVRGFIPVRSDVVRALPPTFQLVGGVVHLSRGDYLERYRPDRRPFPRYDCEAAAGVLFPDTDVAVHLACGASVRAPLGFASLYGFYNRGVAGVTNNENAEVSLSYAIAF